MSDKVSYQEQVDMGLIRNQRQAFVPALRGEVLPPAPAPAPAPATNTMITFDSQPGATSHIEVKTSFWDRAKGFTLMTSQLSLLYGFAFVVVGRVVADIPIFSIWGLLMFLIAYSLTWGFAYMQTLHYSPEGIQARESDKKLGIIELDVRKRWEYMEREQAQTLQERREDRTEARSRRLGGK